MGKDGKDPRHHPSFPRTRESRVKQSTPFSSPSPREGDACEARRGCTKLNYDAHDGERWEGSPRRHPVIPASTRRHSRARGNPE